MKRSECTVEALKALGYTAKTSRINNWRPGLETVYDCNDHQSKELFDLVVRETRRGGGVEIRRNNYHYTVMVFLDCLKGNEAEKHGFTHYLSRPMTEAERLEADLITGRGVDWDWVPRNK